RPHPGAQCHASSAGTISPTRAAFASSHVPGGWHALSAERRACKAPPTVCTPFARRSGRATHHGFRLPVVSNQLLFLIALFTLVATSSTHADVTVPGETGNSLRRIQAVDRSLAD